MVVTALLMFRVVYRALRVGRISIHFQRLQEIIKLFRYDKCLTSEDLIMSIMKNYTRELSI